MQKTPRQKTNKYANLRRTEIKDPRKFIVLIVEGERTEKFYFQMIENKFSYLVKLEIVEPQEKKSAPKHLLKSAIIKKVITKEKL
ncbi:MAG: RloB domain-containing protein [Pelagibacterales bacterium]|nr:RloB domain-containing protein [Pelagibacterales bacterium]